MNHWTLTVDDLRAFKMTSIMGVTNSFGGITAHILSRSNVARSESSGLFLTTVNVSGCSSKLENADDPHSLNLNISGCNECRQSIFNLQHMMHKPSMEGCR